MDGHLTKRLLRERSMDGPWSLSSVWTSCEGPTRRMGGMGEARTNWATLRATLMGLLLLSGCRAPIRTWQPPQDPAKLNDVQFVHYLATVPTVTVGEGTRAVLLLVGSTEQWPTFDDQWSELFRRGAVRNEWRLHADQILDQGTLGYMVRTLCSLPAGVNETLTRATHWGERRYALKACVDQGLMDYGLANEPVRGGPLVETLRRAEDCAVVH